jgi:hypothetical protein
MIPAATCRPIGSPGSETRHARKIGIFSDSLNFPSVLLPRPQGVDFSLSSGRSKQSNIPRLSLRRVSEVVRIIPRVRSCVQNSLSCAVPIVPIVLMPMLFIKRQWCTALNFILSRWNLPLRLCSNPYAIGWTILFTMPLHFDKSFQQIKAGGSIVAS